MAQFLIILNKLLQKQNLIQPSKLSREIQSSTLNKFAILDNFSSTYINDDQAVLLVLACTTFREIPQCLHKYFYVAQEEVHHAY